MSCCYICREDLDLDDLEKDSFWVVTCRGHSAHTRCLFEWQPRSVRKRTFCELCQGSFETSQNQKLTYLSAEFSRYTLDIIKDRNYPALEDLISKPTLWTVGLFKFAVEYCLDRKLLPALKLLEH